MSCENSKIRELNLSLFSFCISDSAKEDCGSQVAKSPKSVNIKFYTLSTVDFLRLKSPSLISFFVDSIGEPSWPISTINILCGCNLEPLSTSLLIPQWNLLDYYQPFVFLADEILTIDILLCRSMFNLVDCRKRVSLQFFETKPPQLLWTVDIVAYLIWTVDLLNRWINI